MSAPLLVVVLACALGAVALAIYTGMLLRERRPEVTASRPPVLTAAPVRLPGMPPVRLPPAPATWAAVERQLDAPRRATGPVPPPPRVAANRFDEVATTGLPVVRPAAPES